MTIQRTRSTGADGSAEETNLIHIAEAGDIGEATLSRSISGGSAAYGGNRVYDRNCRITAQGYCARVPVTMRQPLALASSGSQLASAFDPRNDAAATTLVPLASHAEASSTGCRAAALFVSRCVTIA